MRSFIGSLWKGFFTSLILADVITGLPMREKVPPVAINAFLKTKAEASGKPEEMLFGGMDMLENPDPVRPRLRWSLPHCHVANQKNHPPM